MTLVSSRIQINEAVVSAELEDEAVLLNVETGLYFGLGEAELLVWTLLGDGLSVEEIHQRLLEEYDVEAEQLRSDLNGLIGALIERELVRVDG